VDPEKLDSEVAVGNAMANAMREDPFLPYQGVDDQFPYQKYGTKADIRAYYKPVGEDYLIRKITELKLGTVGARAVGELFNYILADAEMVGGEIQALLMGKSLSTGGRNMLDKINSVLEILGEAGMVPEATKIEFTPLAHDKYYQEAVRKEEVK